LADALGQLVELGPVEALPRLTLLRDDLLDGAREHALVGVVRRGSRGQRGEERVEGPDEGAPLRVGAAHFAARLSAAPVAPRPAPVDSLARSSRASERYP